MRTFEAPRGQRALVAMGVLVAALLATVVQPVGSAAAATPLVPTPPTLPAAIEPFPEYQGAQLCDPVAHTGPKKLQAVLTATYGTTAYGITRSCSGTTGTSEHMEGRALDWMISGTTQKARANAFIAWLFKDDAAGNRYAMARRMGIMYIVWDNRMFRLYDVARGWTEYDGCYALTASTYDTNCHRNHVHFSFTWDGAGAATSYWSGTAVTTPSCPSAPAAAAPPAVPTSGLEFVAVPPARILDTGTAAIGVSARCRLSQDRWTGDERRIDLQVSGRGGVPATGVAAVTLALQVKLPNAPTRLLVEPTGQTAAPLTASTTAMRVDGLGEVTVPLGSGGRVSFTLSTGSAFVAADVLGYYRAADGSGLLFHPAQPVRLSTDTASATGQLAAGESRTIQVAGRAGVPEGAAAVTMAVTLWDPVAAGGATVYGADDAAPPSTLLSVTSPAANRRTNLVVSRVSSSGDIVVRNDSNGPRTIVLDLVGWWAPASVPGGSTYVLLPAKEVIDTTEGTGKGITGALTAARVATVTLPGLGGVPSSSSVTAVALQTTALGPTADTALVTWPGSGSKPAVRLASVRKGSDHTAFLVAPLAAGKASFGSASGTVGLRSYVVGYWSTP